MLSPDLKVSVLKSSIRFRPEYKMTITITQSLISENNGDAQRVNLSANKSSRNMSQEAVLYINHKFIEVKTAITRYPIILNVNN